MNIPRDNNGSIDFHKMWKQTDWSDANVGVETLKTVHRMAILDRQTEIRNLSK